MAHFWKIAKIQRAKSRYGSTSPRDLETPCAAQAGFSRKHLSPAAEVEPYRGFARCILAIFQKYAIFAQF